MTDSASSSELTKKQAYFRQYYKDHNTVVGKYTIKKYAKSKYKLSDADCEQFGMHVCAYAKYKKLKEQLQQEFPDIVF